MVKNAGGVGESRVREHWIRVIARGALVKAALKIRQSRSTTAYPHWCCTTSKSHDPRAATLISLEVLGALVFPVTTDCDLGHEFR